MTRVVWDAVGTRYHQYGVDRGMLYVGSSAGVPWSGLTSIEQRPTNGTATPYYIDGEKYLNLPSAEEYEATINAITYPDQFGVCDGSVQATGATGLFVMNQLRVPFGLSYRTLTGNGLTDPAFTYKIHIVYGALAEPSPRVKASISDQTTPMLFSWHITTTPSLSTGYKNTAHVVLDSRIASSGAVSAVEDILYGSVSTSPRLPLLAELITVVNSH